MLFLGRVSSDKAGQELQGSELEEDMDRDLGSRVRKPVILCGQKQGLMPECSFI